MGKKVKDSQEQGGAQGKDVAGHEMPTGGMEATGSGNGSSPGGMNEGTTARGMSYGAMGEASQGGGMTGGGMGEQGGKGEMPGGGMEGGPQSVLVELRIPSSLEASFALEAATGLSVPGFELDTSYDPIPVGSPPDLEANMAEANEQTVIVRGTIDAEKIKELEARPDVVKVWKDTLIAPFAVTTLDAAPGGASVEEETETFVAPMRGFATCPIGTCDCSPGVAKGTIADVANYLGVNQIWAEGRKGDGIVVGVVDGGITAQGRTISSSDTSSPGWPNKLIPRVIGGWPTASWGTTGVAWDWHGNMCSTDVLGMAPNAQVYDIRISGGSIAATISAALAGFQWAIDQHRANGTPHILTNSWGIYQEAWDADYARNPNHPFTRKVVDALNEGIIVLFAAGNCGNTCADGRCGSDSGPGKSIWGANGHPRVITVGAVNKNEQFVGYSSQGPAALDGDKPDFCSVTHFAGFFPSDNGTSAATPIAAGVVALLKQANPSVSQDQVKSVLKETAKQIGPAGYNRNSGSGIIRAKQAYDRIAGLSRSSGPVVSWGANRLDAFVVGTDSALYHKWWNGSSWGPSLTGYEFQGGKVIAPPEAVSWGPDRLDVFVVGTDHALYHKWWNGSAWGPSLTGYEYQGGILVGKPKAVAWGPNRLDVFVVGTDRALYHKWWNGSSWGPSLTGYEFQGGKIIRDPEVVSWGANRLDVFAVGTDSALYHKWWNGSSWGPSLTGYEFQGGIIVGKPKAVAWGPNRLDVFVVGTDHALYHKWWNGSSWGPSLTGYEFQGGKIVSDPEVVSWGPDRLDVFVVGTDRALYHKWWNGSSWGPSLTGWENLGGTILGQPHAVAWGPNRLDVFVVGTDRALYHKWWNGSSWGPSLTGYEYQGGVVGEF
jgi:ABC-type taurine transport system substrate-binding protein